MEQKFQSKYTKEVDEVALFYLFVNIVSSILFITFQIYKVSVMRSYDYFAAVCGLSFLFFACPAIHYFIMRKFKVGSTLFSPLQTFIMVLLYNFRADLGTVVYSNLDSDIIVMVFGMILGLISNGQIFILVSYLSCIAYNFLYTYWQYKDQFRYIKHAMYFNFSFIILFAFQRRNLIKVRQRFEKD